MQTYFSNGKLLLTGEYVVLDGALSLAIPTKYGQSLEIETIRQQKLIWTSLNEKDDVWFQDTFEIINNEISLTTKNNNDVSKRLLQILTEAKKLNPDFLNTKNGFKVTTKLDFPTNWGLGTSSTLINNIAQWANIDAFQLLENTFRGSGYDIACAQHDSAITYQRLTNNDVISRDIQNNKSRNIKEITFNPSFKKYLYFVHLNKKQNSREGIAHYNKNKEYFNVSTSEINAITSKLINTDTLEGFEALITQHEKIISKLTKQTPIKNSLFNDFKGSIKSLGAWGGDFILVASKESPIIYFKDKGYHTIISYVDMVK